MNATIFLVSTLFNLYLMLVILRFWLQTARADFYNPLSQFVVKATHPLLAPMRSVIPSLGKIDTAVVVLAWIVAFSKILTLNLLFGTTLPPITSLLMFSFFDMIREGLSLMFWVLILRAILSWFSQGQNPVELVMHQLTEPLLAPIRRVIPTMGGLDFSVLVAIIALQFLQKLIQDMMGLY